MWLFDNIQYKFVFLILYIILVVWLFKKKYKSCAWILVVTPFILSLIFGLLIYLLFFVDFYNSSDARDNLKKMGFQLEDKIIVADKEHLVSFLDESRRAKFVITKADKKRMITTIKNSPYFNKGIKSNSDTLEDRGSSSHFSITDSIFSREYIEDNYADLQNII